MPKDPSPSHSREFTTLLNELRVLLPGVEVLFAFLLTVPFTSRFDSTTPVQRAAYFLAFLAAASSSVLLVTPGVYHRLRWRNADKEHVLRVGNLCAIGGTACLAVALSASVFVVTDMLFSASAAAACTSVVVAAMISLWYVLPLWARRDGFGSRRRKRTSAEPELEAPAARQRG